MDYFCAKDNREVDISKGCRHPHDYCKFRQSCIIHLLDQERKRKDKGGVLSEDDADSLTIPGGDDAEEL